MAFGRTGFPVAPSTYTRTRTSVISQGSHEEGAISKSRRYASVRTSGRLFLQIRHAGWSLKLAPSCLRRLVQPNPSRQISRTPILRWPPLTGSDHRPRQLSLQRPLMGLTCTSSAVSRRQSRSAKATTKMIKSAFGVQSVEAR